MQTHKALINRINPGNSTSTPPTMAVTLPGPALDEPASKPLPLPTRKAPAAPRMEIRKDWPGDGLDRGVALYGEAVAAAIIHKSEGLNGKLPPSPRSGSGLSPGRLAEVNERRSRVFNVVLERGPIAPRDIALVLKDLKSDCISDHLSVLRQEGRIINKTTGIWEVCMTYRRPKGTVNEN